MIESTSHHSSFFPENPTGTAEALKVSVDLKTKEPPTPWELATTVSSKPR
jgi:hypothetical protein